jgi:hypothetical protein
MKASKRWCFRCLLVLSLAPGFSSPAAVSGDEHWDNQFGPVGANNSPFVLTAARSRVFVGGQFTAAGNLKLNFVSGFDGTNWLPLNAGLGTIPFTSVTGLGSDGVYVYAGGTFTNADNSGAQFNARWDGTNWSPLSVGLNGPGFVFKTNGGSLYVGGTFTGAGNTIVSNIARWDGTNWWPLGLGVAGPTASSGVDCLAFQGNNVYVGGIFVSAGGLSATNVAWYDGSNWHAMGNGLNGPLVTALTFYGAYLYAGGSFTNTGLGFTNLARWDGSAWSAVPGGGANGDVRDIVTDGTNLYVGGLFTNIGGIAAAEIARFDGATWTTLGSGIRGFGPRVYRMVWQSNQLYVVGVFSTAGNTGAANVARWDGTNWWDLGGQASKGIYDPIAAVLALLPDGTNLYAGGLFPAAGNVVVSNVTRWDGANWHALTNGISGSLPGFRAEVAALATANLNSSGTNLYVGGNFTNAGGVAAQCIARWDGTNWGPLGAGVDYTVLALARAASRLYVGGTFTNAGGLASKGLAFWDGTNWFATGGVNGTNPAVNALAYDGNSGNLYVGGTFTAAGAAAATNVALYNGSSWSALGNGVGGAVKALAFSNGVLYAGGAFTAAGGSPANRIAKWDGSTWSALGSGVIGSPAAAVDAIVISGTNVFVSGNFTNAGGIVISNLARWNGAAWSALGSGLSKIGNAMTLAGNDLFVGGDFAIAGDKPAQAIARWNEQLNFYPPANMRLIRTAWLTNHQFQARLIGTSGQSFIIQGSTNLGAWTPLQTNSTMFYDFTDPAAAGYSNRFYRAVLGP